jgi:hypothetical protein
LKYESPGSSEPGDFCINYVGAIIDRPQILLCKICRRKAKILLFSFGKSEKLCFSAGDQ